MLLCIYGQEKKKEKKKTIETDNSTSGTGFSYRRCFVLSDRSQSP